MEPKSLQGGDIPVWIGGPVPRTLERVAEYGDGWMGQFVKNADTAAKLVKRIDTHAAAVGRDAANIGKQLMLAPWQGEPDSRNFYTNPERLRERTIELKSLGLNWMAIDSVTLFQLGHRSVDAMLDLFGEIYTAIKPELE